MESAELAKELNALKEEERHLQRRLSHIKPHQFDTLKEFREARTKLQKQNTETSQKISPLQEKYDAQVRQEKIERTRTFIAENIELVRVEKDNSPLPIDKKALTVTVPFTNCSHRKTFSLNDLIPYEQERLWHDILKEGLRIPVYRPCEQCRNDRKSFIAKFHHYKDTPLGHVNIIIRALH